METILLAFANQQSDLLPTLQQEDDALNRLLSPREKERHFLLNCDSFITLDKLPSKLILYRDSLALFHFSGHAGRHQLLLTDGQANSAGIAQMLGQCPKLKLVFLNGCSTEGQVAQLFDQNIPVIIATSAPVEDKAATFFSTKFYEALAQQYTIQEAFNMAKGAVETAFSGISVGQHRSFILTAPEKPTWGLYCSEKHQHVLNWKLPAQPINVVVQANFTPNQYLIDTLFKSLAAFNDHIALLNQQDKGLTKVTLPIKRMAVLNALPAPLAEPLRKLIVPMEKANEGYDKVSLARLRQLWLAYQTAVELLSFTMLAQLWEAYDAKGSIDMTDEQRAALRHFFSMTQEAHEAYNLLDLTGILRSIFATNGITYFVGELESISQRVASDKAFAASLQFMFDLRLKIRQAEINAADLAVLCKKAEEGLTDLCASLGFLARYRLATIQGIDVEKYRHRRVPSYNHATVVLHDLLGGFDLSSVSLGKSLDNRSVLLINDQTWEYLNLSPFIMDENAFHDNTDICKLFYFSHYSSAAGAVFFKYVNKPDDPLLEIPGEKFALVKEQFEAFATLLLQQSLESL